MPRSIKWSPYERQPLSRIRFESSQMLGAPGRTVVRDHVPGSSPELGWAQHYVRGWGLYSATVLEYCTTVTRSRIAVGYHRLMLRMNVYVSMKN